MEIGIAPQIPTYAGGLGVLAGDTVRAAADLGLPFVAVTLLHRHGYVHQRLDAAGRQREENAPHDRALSHDLYVGNAAYRLAQEAVLGIGGVPVLRALGYSEIERFHLKEGHSALLTSELVAERLRRSARKTVIDEDCDAVRRLCVFALVREGDGWRVFVAGSGRARARAVTIGHQGEFEVQILDGLRAGELVVRHPTDRVVDGSRIRVP